jgi:hypothetical protein
LLKFENEFIDIENHEFDGKKWEERGMRNKNKIGKINTKKQTP